MGPHVETYFMMGRDEHALDRIQSSLPYGRLLLLRLTRIASRQPSTAVPPEILLLEAPDFEIKPPPDIPEALTVMLRSDEYLGRLANTDHNLRFLSWLGSLSEGPISYVYHYGHKGLEYEYFVGVHPPACMYNDQEFIGHSDDGPPNSATAAALRHLGIDAPNFNEQDPGFYPAKTEDRFLLLFAQSERLIPLDHSQVILQFQRRRVPDALLWFVKLYGHVIDRHILEHLFRRGPKGVAKAAGTALRCHLKIENHEDARLLQAIDRDLLE